MREPRNLRENQSLKAQGLEYRFPKIIGGELGEISGEWETHTVEYKPEWDAYGFNLTEMAVKGSGIPAPLIYRVQGETLTELQELPLSTIPPVSFYCIDYHGTGFESTSRIYMHEDTNGWTILVKRYAGLGRVPQHPRKTGFVFNALKIGGSAFGVSAPYAGATSGREQLAVKEIVLADVEKRFNLCTHGITNGKSRIVSWSAHYSPGSAKFRDVSFLPSALDASRWHGSYPDAAVTDLSETPADFRGVAYGNGIWVAVATPSGGSTSVYSSPNGIQWTRRTATAANSWNGVAFGNGWFVAVASSGTNRVMRSQDGITWTAASAAEANNWNAVAFGDGRFIAVANSGTNRAMISTDNGATWTASGLTLNATNIVYGESIGTWVASSPQYFRRSTDNGATWTDQVWIGDFGEGFSTMRPPSFGNGYFVSPMHNPATNALAAFISNDGATWTKVSIATGIFDSICSVFGLGLHVIVWEEGLYVSDDGGATWSARSGPLNNLGTSGVIGQPRAAAFGQSMFVAVCESGILAHSEKNFADDGVLSVITDIDNEAPSVARDVYVYVLYKQA